MKAKITIQLDYDLEELRFMVGEDFSPTEFRGYVIDQAQNDLWEYIRNNDLTDYAKLEITE
jgi:hypothetical protein